MKKHYDERKVLNELAKKRVTIDYSMKVITINNESGTCGIHSWGKIDFLVKFCGWKYISKKGNIKKTKEYNIKRYKKLKKEEKQLLKNEKNLEETKLKKNSIVKNTISKAKKEMFKVLNKIKH